MIKKKKYSALILLRKKDPFCKKFLKSIKLYSKKVKVFWTDHNTKKLSAKRKYDFIISYRSSIILKPKDISLASIAAINLHPGPPKYRGIGCLNYALYNNEKKYGFTIHLMSKKIDYGEILFVKYFLIKKNDSVASLLLKTHKQCIAYSKVFFRNILSDARKIETYKEQFKKEKWSKIIKNKKQLDEFYRIRNFNLREVNKKIRSTNYANFKPFIQIGHNKFTYKQT